MAIRFRETAQQLPFKGRGISTHSDVFQVWRDGLAALVEEPRLESQHPQGGSPHGLLLQLQVS